MKSYACEEFKESLHTSSIGKFSCNSPLEEQSIPSTSNGSVDKAPILKKASSDQKVKHKSLTKKDMGLHKLIFTNEALRKEITKMTVVYKANDKVRMKGQIQDSAILCFHCMKVISPSQFEAHAGFGQKRKPYHNIYLSNGVSLHELSVRIAKELPDRERDKLCNICGEDGELLGCHHCPRAFHQGCVKLLEVPKGKWECRYCENLHQRDNTVKYNGNAIASGRIPRTDPVEPILRSIRLKKSTIDSDGCVFCRQRDFSTSGFGPRTVIICDQCQKEHHVECLKTCIGIKLKELPQAEWFCCSDCHMIYVALQELIHKGAIPLPELDANVIKRKLEEKSPGNDANIDIRWRLLNGRNLDGDSKLLLSEAVAVFSESINLIDDCVTKEELISTMVNGEKLSDEKDYTGMYCAVLIVSSTVQSAGIIRVLQSNVAELPLVSSRKDCQRLGYFRALFSCIERFLTSVNVKHLILPSTHETESIWIQKFGFSHVTKYELNNCLKGARIARFEDTTMLWKPVTSAHGNLKET